MARTQGHGNPRWNRDETILALDLYFRSGGEIPSQTSQEVQGLSALLRRLPFHRHRHMNRTFRNPAGVSFKLQNLRQVATGAGLEHVSAMDREVWSELGDQPEEVARLADLIRSAADYIDLAYIEEDRRELFYEGRLLTQVHQARERDRRLRSRVLASHRRRQQPLSCELCGSRSTCRDPAFEDAAFEVHHLVPFAETRGERQVRLTDVALLCACCHRLLHRAIVAAGVWLPLSEARDILGIMPNEAPA
ncbi:MAG: HNH endonuclease [Acidobacteriota bacterium]|nr:HNH endonuclease [Acidobacteriota bacterium]